MQETNQHIILKQFLDIQTPNQKDSFDLQQRVGQLYWDKIMPILERLFDEYCPENESIQIEKLELDLGTVSLNNLEEALTEKLPIKLKEYLREVLVSNDASKSKGVTRMPLIKGRLSQWIHYLTTGTLSWNTTKLAEKEWQKSILELLATDQSAINQLRELFQKQPIALDRVIQQYEESFLVHLIEVFSAKSQRQLPAYKKVLEKLIQQPTIKARLSKMTNAKSQSLKMDFWSYIFQKMVKGNPKIDSLSLVNSFVKDKWGVASATFSPKIKEAISDNWTPEEKRLSQAIFKQILFLKPNTIPIRTLETEHNIPSNKNDHKNHHNLKHTAAINSLNEQFTTFKNITFKTGTFTWNTREIGTKVWQKTILETIAKETKVMAQISALCRKYPAILKRIAYQSEEIFLYQLLELFTKKIQNALPPLRKLLERLVQHTTIKKALLTSTKESGIPFQSEFWRYQLQRVLVEKSKVESINLTVAFVKEKWSFAPASTSKQEFLALAQSLSVGEKALFKNLFKATLLDEMFKTNEVVSPKKDSTIVLPTIQTKSLAASALKIQEAKESALETHSPAPSYATTDFDALPAGTAYYVENAGVILLHPFLAHFFKELNLLEDKQFKNEAAQHLAVHLIHYLATKEEQAPEHQQLLAKFLAGVHYDQPIARYMEIAEADKAEAEHLLEVCLKRWGALPNTSIDGLQQGFLQRAGKLEKRGDNWHLTIEQKTIDLLLGKLPWNLSLVKLPWLKGLLYVEWGT